MVSGRIARKAIEPPYYSNKVETHPEHLLQGAFLFYQKYIEEGLGSKGLRATLGF